MLARIIVNVNDACYKNVLSLLTFCCYFWLVNDACYMTHNDCRYWSMAKEEILMSIRLIDAKLIQEIEEVAE